MGERVLSTPGNPISLALTLNSLTALPAVQQQQQLQQQQLASGGDAVAAAAPAAVEGTQAVESSLRSSGSSSSSPIQEGSAQPSAPPPPSQQEQLPEGGATAQQRPAGPPITLLGSMLFTRCVSGTRVVARGKRQEVGGVPFVGYGAHCDDYPHDYLTVAAAVGTTHQDIDGFIARLRQCWVEFQRKRGR